ncbi:helix-turn-helix domain-containing protein [Mycobacteroides abscessus]|uniref:helix-turn-helix domain-containing protein n=1 Tax=Mycobacteroides abscessus TaxID=36809 RepID=UPI000940DB2D|nr:helix-turn-helix domain-containing protein [Mycobacteroides abscessus]
MLPGNDLGSFVRAARTRGAISQRDLATLTGYSASWVRQVEANSHTPPESALAAIARALGLSSWETHYLHALGGKMVGTVGLEIPDVSDYLEALNPHPAAYLTAGWTVEHANSEFKRLFKGLWISPNFLNWHYVGRQTPDIVLDWQSSSDWLISWLKFNLALSPEDPDLTYVLRKMAPINDFARHWERNTIPADPASRPWTVRDLDNESVLRIDMRVWRAGQSSDLMLLGVIRGTADA